MHLGKIESATGSEPTIPLVPSPPPQTLEVRVVAYNAEEEVVYQVLKYRFFERKANYPASHTLKRTRGHRGLYVGEGSLDTIIAGCEVGNPL